MKKTLSILLALVLVIGLFAGCGPKQSGEPQGGVSGNSAEDTVRIGIVLSVDSFEPMTAIQREEQYILANVFDTLLELKDGEYVGELAETFEPNEDGTVVTVKLREDVTFHNGEKLTTKDIAYTYDHMKDYSFYANDATYYDHTEIIDEYNCKIYATAPNPLFMMTLATVDIVNEKAITELGADHRFSPVGTGPYKFVSYDGFNNVMLEANEDYFGGVPEIKHLNYRIFGDEQTMTMALEADEVDMLSFVQPANAIRFEGNSKYNVTWKAADGVKLILFNTTQAPFDKKEVRQAISYAIDREAITLIVGEGKGKAWDAFYSEKMAGAPDYDALPHYTYDLEKAKELMAQAGYPDGFTLEEPVRVIQTEEKMAVTLQQQLSQIGINFEVEVVEANTLFNNYLFVLNFNMMPFSLSTEIHDMAYVAQYYDGLSQMPDMTGYKSDEVKALSQQAKETTDLAERKALYTQIFTIAYEDLPICPVMASEVAQISKVGLIDDEKVSTEIWGTNLHWEK
ncbi:ABC transporter substrate-binding protein [Feifania hominis]|uniref:ABC transporter substrate-binding protein n=1 Tax=Feifania hominis TaxID=2763660 RepID=A0A926DFT3_9FIRM|nr:ABC transporter substrate-binding protein [Feifania hominis]MBC8536235.1 ABC transporter substrate-binding protein [Feifania hominis]